MKVGYHCFVSFCCRLVVYWWCIAYYYFLRWVVPYHFLMRCIRSLLCLFPPIRTYWIPFRLFPADPVSDIRINIKLWSKRPYSLFSPAKQQVNEKVLFVWWAFSKMPILYRCMHTLVVHIYHKVFLHRSLYHFSDICLESMVVQV